MSYSYNRKSFESSSSSALAIPILLESYCLCVRIELALKEHLRLMNSSRNGGHDIPNLLQQLSISLLGPDRAKCNALMIQFQNSIGRLWFQGISGSPCQVPNKSYPNIRYIRHNSDWPSPHSTDMDIENMNRTVKDLGYFLYASAGVDL